MILYLVVADLKWDKDKFLQKSNKPEFFVENSFAKFTILSFDQTLKFTFSFQISNSLWSTNRVNIYSLSRKYSQRRR